MDSMNPTADTPITVIDDPAARAGQQPAFDGITVRDYYAAAAMQGIISSHSGEVQMPDEKKTAKWAFGYADQMLAQRAKLPA